MTFTGFAKKYLELNPMNRNECGRPDDLIGLDEIAEVKFDVKYFILTMDQHSLGTKLTEPTCKKIMLPMQYCLQVVLVFSLSE